MLTPRARRPRCRLGGQPLPPPARQILPGAAGKVGTPVRMRCTDPPSWSTAMSRPTAEPPAVAALGARWSAPELGDHDVRARRSSPPGGPACSSASVVGRVVPENPRRSTWAAFWRRVSLWRNSSAGVSPWWGPRWSSRGWKTPMYPSWPPACPWSSVDGGRPRRGCGRRLARPATAAAKGARAPTVGQLLKTQVHGTAYPPREASLYLMESHARDTRHRSVPRSPPAPSAG